MKDETKVVATCSPDFEVELGKLSDHPMGDELGDFLAKKHPGQTIVRKGADGVLRVWNAKTSLPS